MADPDSNNTLNDAMQQNNSTSATTIVGDVVQGDVVQGDKVAGHKIIYTSNHAYHVGHLPNPYLGLRSFTYAERGLYAGREELSANLAQRLCNQRPRFIVIQGASGSGKSSFLRASLIPQFETLVQEAGQTLQCSIIQPSKMPWLQFQHALRSLDVPDHIVPPILTHTTRLIVIDQFEELFTQSEPEQVELLVKTLCALASAPECGLQVILSLRLDYLPHFIEHQRALYECVQNDMVTLYAMSESELQRAIQQPLVHTYKKASMLNGELVPSFEPHLLKRLAHDAANDSAALPLLQATLQDLWDRQELVSTAYSSLADAIGKRADDIYTYWAYQTADQRPRSSAEQRLMLNILLQLVHVSQQGDQQHDARVRRTAQELIGSDNERRLLIEDLVQARLLSKSTELREINGVQTKVEVIDLIHESLIHKWSRLHDAIKDDREQLLQRALFEVALQQWEHHDKSDGYLLDGERLREAEVLRDQGGLYLPPNAIGLIERSSAQRQQRVQERLLFDIQRRSARRLRRMLTVVATLLIVAMGASVIAVHQRSTAIRASEDARESQRQAEIQRNRADRLASAGQALAELTRQPEKAMSLVLHALPKGQMTFTDALTLEPLVAQALYQTYDRARIRQLFERVNATVLGADWTADGSTVINVFSDTLGAMGLRVSDAVSAQKRQELHIDVSPDAIVLFSPNRHYVVIKQHDSSFRCYTTDTLDVVATTPKGQVWEAAAWSSDNQHLVLAARNTPLTIWDISSNSFHHTAIPGSPSAHIAWSPDQEFIATTNTERELEMWDLKDTTKRLHAIKIAASITTLAWTQDSNVVISGDADGMVILRDESTLQEIQRLVGHQQAILAIAMSPDDTRIATGGQDGTLRVWDRFTGQMVFQLYGHTSAIRSVAWSADGKQIISASDDGSTRLWDARPGALQTRLTVGRERAVHAVAWSPDGRYIASGDSLGRVTIWDAEQGEAVVTFETTSDVLSLQWHPHRLWIAAGGGEQMGWVKVWDVINSRLLWEQTHEGPVWSIAWSNQGDRLASAGQNDSVVIHSEKGTLLTTLQGDTPLVRALAWSPDDQMILVGTKHGWARLWRTRNGEETDQVVQQRADIRTAVWDVTGTHAMTGGADTMAIRWDMATGKEMQRFIGHTAMIRSLDWSLDRLRVVTAGNDGTVRIWNANDGNELIAFADHVGAVWSVSWSPDGRKIVSGGEDGSLRIWDANPIQMQQAIRDRICRMSTIAVATPDVCASGTRVP